jgi:thiol-disulfide isomerase/thioredoxin
MRDRTKTTTLWSAWGVLTLLSTAILAAGEPPAELRGQLSRELVLQPQSLMNLPLRDGSVELPEPLPEGALLQVAEIPLGDEPIQVAWIQPQAGDPILYADLNRDGRMSAGERQPPSHRVAELPAFCRPSFHLQVPLAGGFLSYPMEVCRQPEVREMKGQKVGPAIHFTSSAQAEAVVELAGRPTRMIFLLDARRGGIDPANGSLGIDGDGDGKVDPGFGSPEWAKAKGEPVVFEAGGRYVSVRSVDPATGKVVLASHPAADYRRIDLRRGASLPDFTFSDLEGKSHRLSDFRGKHVLLDFWATWCVPCVEELPDVQEVQEKLGPRGLAVVGVIFRDTDDKARALLQERRLTLLQATSASTDELSQKRFGILQIPQSILIDPDGKVALVGEGDALRGPNLLETLGKILPPMAAKPAA